MRSVTSMQAAIRSLSCTVVAITLREHYASGTDGSGFQIREARSSGVDIMGKSSGGGGGGGKGKRISGGGSGESVTTAATATQTPAASRFTPEEQAGIDNTVSKLRQLPEAERQKQISRAEMSVNQRIKDTYNAVQKLENTMKQYEERNPGVTRDNHPAYNDYTKAKTRYESARKDREKFDEVKKSLK